MTTSAAQPAKPSVPLTLRGDFHMHTWFSKDCMTPPEKLVERCRKVGLDCIAMTEHNTIKGALEAKHIAPFRVIVAEEIKTTHGEITGMFLKDEVPKGLSPEETVKRIKAQGGLVSIPHPFDRFRRSPLEYDALLRIVQDVDIIEVFNARTTLLRDSHRAAAFAREHGKVAGAGSDSHSAHELGSVFVHLPEFDINDPQSFKAALNHARIEGRRANPLVHLISKFAKYKKRFGLGVHE